MPLRKSKIQNSKSEIKKKNPETSGGLRVLVIRQAGCTVPKTSPVKRG
jgi:hypothetical protein